MSAFASCKNIAGRLSETFAKKHAVAAANERDKRLRPFQNTPNGKMTIRAFIEKVWLPWSEAEHAVATHSGYQCIMRLHVFPHVGSLRLSEYRPYMMSQYLETLVERGWNRASVNKVKSVMSSIFAQAVARDYVETNPIRDAKMLRTPKAPERQQAYTVDEMRKALSVLTGLHRLFFLLCCLGLRPSEVCGLKREDVEEVDEQHGLIHVRRSGWRGRLMEGGKTGERAVAVLPWVVADLVAHMATHPTSKGLLLESSRGNMVNPRLLAQQMQITFAEHGIPWKAFYSARRAASSEAVHLAKGEAQIVAPNFGHSVAISQSHYQLGDQARQRENALQYASLLAPEADSETVQ